MRKGKFCKYDYGQNNNTIIYLQSTPPEYDMNNIDIPIALFSGLDDKLTGPSDVKWILDKLGSKVVKAVTYPKMGHVTFMIGKDM